MQQILRHKKLREAVDECKQMLAAATKAKKKKQKKDEEGAAGAKRKRQADGTGNTNKVHTLFSAMPLLLSFLGAKRGALTSHVSLFTFGISVAADWKLRASAGRYQSFVRGLAVWDGG